MRGYNYNPRKPTLKLHPANGRLDHRKELGLQLAPYGRFDSNIERFCCVQCGKQFETYRGIEAHIMTEHI